MGEKFLGWETMPMSTSVQQSRILVVNGERPFLDMVVRIFHIEDFTNITATTDPFEALAMVDSQTPELILLDLSMPALDCYGFLGELRKDGNAGTEIPVIVVTGLATEQSRQRTADAGAQDLLEKPFTPEQLITKATKWLERTH